MPRDRAGHAPIQSFPMCSQNGAPLPFPAPQSRGISSPSFLIEPPRAIPVGGRRVSLEEVDAADKRAGRPVAGNSLKCRAKCATRFVPLACSICGKALRISGPQQ